MSTYLNKNNARDSDDVSILNLIKNYLGED